jgi:hypothetical protein
MIAGLMSKQALCLGFSRCDPQKIFSTTPREPDIRKMKAAHISANRFRFCVFTSALIMMSIQYR